MDTDKKIEVRKGGGGLIKDIIISSIYNSY